VVFLNTAVPLFFLAIILLFHFPSPPAVHMKQASPPEPARLRRGGQA